LILQPKGRRSLGYNNMLRLKTSITFICLLLTAYLCRSQNNQVMPRLILLEKLSRTGGAKARATVLIDICWSYRSAGMPDSVVYFARQALALSDGDSLADLHNQAYFLIVKALAMGEHIREAIDSTEKSVGPLKVRLLVELGEHFTFKLGGLPKNMQRAYPFIRHALAYSDSIHCTDCKMDVNCLLAKFYFISGDIPHGKIYFLENVRLAEAGRDIQKQAHWWSELGLYMPSDTSTYKDIIQYHTKAVRLYMAAGNRREATYSLRDIADIHCQSGQPAKASIEYNEVITALKEMKVAKLYTTYDALALAEKAQGNLDSALSVILLAEDNMKALHQDVLEGVVEMVKGSIYWNLGDIRSSNRTFEIAIKTAQAGKDRVIYYCAERLAEGLVRLGQAEEARNFLVKFASENQPIRPSDRKNLAMAWGVYYEALGKNDEAEAKFKEMISWQKEGDAELIREIQGDFRISWDEVYYTIGRFYVHRGELAVAGTYLRKGLESPGHNTSDRSVPVMRDIYGLLYKVDSAGGSLALALKDHVVYKALADSLSSVAKEREIARLEIQYATREKDQQLEMLSQKEALERNTLNRSDVIRNLTFAGIAVLLLITGLIVRQYLLNKENAREISIRNETLQRLLQEKELLVREIHHRVKNNFQVIINLLESYEPQLTGKALEAILASQNRVYAMSLIHQKLYSQTGQITIPMQAYIAQLVDHLRDSYQARNRIQFRLNLDPIELDVSQAIATGLILNEAVTNAIKYAFGEPSGHDAIYISFRELGNLISFTIADNGSGATGKGRDAGKQSMGRQGLGLELLKGLTEDMGGSLSINTKEGTIVTIEFKPYLIRKQKNSLA
jgi:two-component system, sensor histidine kinase PdtaS